MILFARRTRGAAFRALALAAMVAALANPTLREEERENLGNIAIAVLDESTSQSLAGRPEQTAAIRKKLEASLGQIKNLDVKWVSSSRPRDNARSGTTVFADLNKALADTPPDRLAGVIIISDGQVHDVPNKVDQLGFQAPVHTLLTGRKDEFDRRIEVIEAPRYGIVGQSRDIQIALRQTGKVPRSAPTNVTVNVRRAGAPDETFRAAIGSKLTLPMQFPHAGQNIVEIELTETEGELTTANNRVVVLAEGVRENLRVLAGVRQAARRRADLAQPAQVGCRCRSRPFHHSQAAAETGRDADQPALADRFSDARTVLAEDRGVRSHHLRPLSAPRHSAPALLRQHRALRAAPRWCVAGCRR